MVKLGKKYEKTFTNYKTEAKFYLDSNNYDYKAACKQYLEDLQAEEEQFISEKSMKK